MGVHFVTPEPPVSGQTGGRTGGRTPLNILDDLMPMGGEFNAIRQGLKWDYAQLGEAGAGVREHAVRIKLAERRANEASIEAGQHLLAVKELLPHGAWGDWLETEFQMSDSTAQTLMNIARRFGSNSQPVGNLSYSVLAMLTAKSVPEEAVTEVIQRAQAGETVTKATAKAVIETHKAPVQRLFVDDLKGLVAKWMGMHWQTAWPDNPSHTNGQFWRELTAWMHTNVNSPWTEGDLKEAVKQIHADSQRRWTAQAQAPVSPAAATVVVGQVQPGRGQLVAKHAIWKWLTEQCGQDYKAMVELAEALHYQEASHAEWFKMYPKGADIDDVFWGLEECIDQAAALVPEFAQGQTAAAYVPMLNLANAVLTWVRDAYDEYHGQVAALQCMVDDPLGDEDVQRLEPTLPTPYRKDDLVAALQWALAHLRKMDDDPEEEEETAEGAEGAENTEEVLTAGDLGVMQGLPPLRLPSARLMQLKGLRAEFAMFVDESLATFGDLTGQHTATLEVGRKVMQLAAVLDREIELLTGKEAAAEAAMA